MLGADWLADVIIRGILTHNLSSYFTPSISHVITGPCCGFLSVGMALTSCSFFSPSHYVSFNWDQNSLILFLCFTRFKCLQVFNI